MRRLQVPLMPCCLNTAGLPACLPARLPSHTPACTMAWTVASAGEMSDAGETLLSMYDQIREASTQTAGILDLVLGLRVSEAVVCSSCRKVTHSHAYTQYFYNTRVSGWSGQGAGDSGRQLPAGEP